MIPEFVFALLGGGKGKFMKKDRLFFLFVFAIVALTMMTVIARYVKGCCFDFGYLIDKIASKVISGEFCGVL